MEKLTGVYRCEMCNQKDDIDNYIVNSPITKIMGEQHICYHCAYWLWRHEEDERLLKKQSLRYDKWNFNIPIIIGNDHYVYDSTKRMLNIGNVLLNNGMITNVNNFSFQGVIPGRFKELFPSNAIILQPDEIQKFLILKSRSHQSPINTPGFVPEDLVKNLFDNYYKSK